MQMSRRNFLMSSPALAVSSLLPTQILAQMRNATVALCP